MTTPDGADVFAPELRRRPRIDDLHIRLVDPRHHLLGRDRGCWIDFQLECDGRKFCGFTAGRPAGCGPALDAFVVDADVGAAEILDRVKSEIGIPGAAAAVDDGFTLRVETRRAE